MRTKQTSSLAADLWWCHFIICECTWGACFLFLEEFKCK